MAVRQSSDYTQQLQQLLPAGPAWDKDLYPLPHDVIQSFARALSSVDKRNNDLLSEMFPATIRELLVDWERVMGLPDPCLGEAGSSSERIASVIRRFSEVGRQDAAYFVDIARRFGYPDAWVEEWRAPRFGRMRFGQARFGGWNNQFIWVMHMETRLPGSTRFGAARFGERFGSNPNDIVECVIRRYAPAHTQVYFDYS